MKVFASTDVGKAREMNQDYYYISNESDIPQIYILADGMGGYTGGEIASQFAVKSARQYIQNNWQQIEAKEDSIVQLIKDATQYANMVVYEESKKNEILHDMGTTLEICLFYQDKIFISHIGDSRVYAVTAERIEKITSDHSYVEKLVKDGTITREEAKNHPKKNMLMKALGCTAYVEPDIMVREWKEEESIVICSDGLTNMVSEEEIQETTLNSINPEKMLIKSANDSGGLDNITVIVIKH